MVKSKSNLFVFLMKVIYPYYWQIYQHIGSKWYRLPANRVSNEPEKFVPQHIEKKFGFTEKEIIVNLFKINSGWQGYYIANLKEHKFFYCGTQWEDVNNTFQSFGVSHQNF